MTATFIIQIIITGIGAGLFSGMFGLGGGIVILPVLILLFQWDVYLATGTSLTALLMPTGFFALNNYRKNNLLFIKGSALLALGMICGCRIGAEIAVYIVNGTYMKILFGIYQIIIGLKYARPIYTYNKIFAPHKNNKHTEENYRLPTEISLFIFVVTGIGSGILAGMFGIGGGLFITTLLISIYKINPKQAVAMSLAAMFLPVGIGGVLVYSSQSFVNFTVAVLIAVGMEIGSSVSSKAAIKLDNRILKQLFGIMLILCGLYFCFEKYIYF